MVRLVLLAMAAVAAVAAGCDSTTPRSEGATFVVDVVGEAFRIRVTDPERIAEARSLLRTGTSRIVMGTLARGSGGFNRGYSWHLVPASITFPEMAIELCDGRPSFVEEEVDYWVDTVKRYCPWSARIVREE